jgi:hypothetical protein
MDSSRKQKLLICVIHTQKLQLREPTLKATLTNLKSIPGWETQVEFINEHEPDTISQTFIKENIKLENPQLGNVFDQLVRSLHIKQVSQVLKHKAAFETFQKQTGYEFLLVLEDDVLCSNTIQNDLANALVTFKASKADIISLSSPVPKNVNGNTLNLFDHFRFLPTADAYLVKRSSIQTLVNNFLPIRYQANIHISYICQTNKLSLEIYSPNIFVNGSKYGVFLSSLEQNNRLFMNQEYNRLQNLLTADEIGPSEDSEIKSIINKFAFKEHPDFMYQVALYHMKKKDYTEAKKYFETAFKVFQENDCIMNSESEFLLHYSRIYKFLQK